MSCNLMHFSYTEYKMNLEQCFSNRKSYIDKQKMKEMRQNFPFIDYIVKPPKKKNYIT